SNYTVNDWVPLLILTRNPDASGNNVIDEVDLIIDINRIVMKDTGMTDEYSLKPPLRDIVAYQ
ncbi:7261_t:CDS:1, partial [Acaulospora colombiana]